MKFTTKKPEPPAKPHVVVEVVEAAGGSGAVCIMLTRADSALQTPVAILEPGGTLRLLPISRATAEDMGLKVDTDWEQAKKHLTSPRAFIKVVQ